VLAHNPGGDVQQLLEPPPKWRPCIGEQTPTPASQVDTDGRLRGSCAIIRPHRKMVRPRLPNAEFEEVKTDISVAVDAILGGRYGTIRTIGAPLVLAGESPAALSSHPRT